MIEFSMAEIIFHAFVCIISISISLCVIEFFHLLFIIITQEIKG